MRRFSAAVTVSVSLLTCLVCGCLMGGVEAAGAVSAATHSGLKAADKAAVPASGLLCGAVTADTAFVSIHYEGTERDEEYLLGLRVLHSSLRRHHSESSEGRAGSGAAVRPDFVVLVSPSVSNTTVATLCSDGAVVEVRCTPSHPIPCVRPEHHPLLRRRLLVS